MNKQLAISDQKKVPVLLKGEDYDWLTSRVAELEDTNVALAERVRVLEAALEKIQIGFIGSKEMRKIAKAALHSPPAQAGQAEGG